MLIQEVMAVGCRKMSILVHKYTDKGFTFYLCNDIFIVIRMWMYLLKGRGAYERRIINGFTGCNLLKSV